MKQKLWVVYGIDKFAEYDEMDFVYDICLTQEAATKSLKEGKKKEHGCEFWIYTFTAHD